MRVNEEVGGGEVAVGDVAIVEFGDDEADFATVFHRAAVRGRRKRRRRRRRRGGRVLGGGVARRRSFLLLFFLFSFFIFFRRDRFQNLLQRLPLHPFHEYRRRPLVHEQNRRRLDA